ncbi:hypothetical protein QPL79_03295 [Ignisphaera sp. 4213-co]|uniref:CopG family transcriptional regulator n=1 Tax=Ignisphaera cupida TaxID=3050454 RepID=A0ABD4Z4Z4_9CREN|nr:hypothetical protein [Ignisphaera sp. 4213-co]MDK6028387.1 hypothetical protein [Ignisphaera sp. 4213-co]
MQEDLSKKLLEVPSDVLKEIEEYEETMHSRRTSKRRKYPSNEDIVNAIRNVTGGVVNRHNIDLVFDAVKQYLEEQGFDTSALNESRFWRLLSSLVRKNVIRTELE